MKDHSELERAIERAAKRHRENALVNEHLGDLQMDWELMQSLDTLSRAAFSRFRHTPNPEPWQRPEKFREGKVSDQFIWLN